MHNNLVIKLNGELMTIESIGLVQQGDLNINSIKTSRKIRTKNIDLKNKFHKKHPKSIEYHEQNKSTNMNKPKETPILINIPRMEKALNSETVTVPNNLSREDKRKLIISKSKISHKTSNQLQLMLNNLTKAFKKEGVFFNSTQNFESVNIMKDYNTTIQIDKLSIQTNVRIPIVVFKDFKDYVLAHPGDFSMLKSYVSKLIFDANKTLNPKIKVESTINGFIDSHIDNPNFNKHISNLITRFIPILKKSSKQPNGFEDKIKHIYRLWLDEMQEISNIQHIENELNFKSYEQSFPLARSMKRKFFIFIGKTNSGKTHAALDELAKGINGVYLAPLRLMAQEGQESLNDRGITTSLITGEERNIIEEASHISSTIEMCNMSKMIDVAVIDEIQTISDDSRGWAWSQALVGIPAKNIYLVGSEEALPFIIPILTHLGEEYEIKRFQRKTPLEVREPLAKLKDLKSGDCVVVFSRKSALEMKNLIESNGKKCSVIYGNLSPDVRRIEAQKFKSGENPILVATDAIGMGLNLPISRIFFSTLEKYDGIETRYLHSSEIKQIAGRAGRYGFADSGEVSLLTNDNHYATTLLHNAVYGGYDEALDTRVPVGPNLQQIKTICDILGKNDLYSALIFFKEKLIRDNPLYKAANLDSMIELAGIIKNKKLELSNGLNYSCVPIDTNYDIHMNHYHLWLNNHIAGKVNLAPELPEVIQYSKNDSYSLYEAELYVKLAMAYRWFHYKYPDTYPEFDIVTERADITNDYIEKSLHNHIIINSNHKNKKFK